MVRARNLWWPRRRTRSSPVSSRFILLAGLCIVSWALSGGPLGAQTPVERAVETVTGGEEQAAVPGPDQEQAGEQTAEPGREGRGRAGETEGESEGASEEQTGLFAEEPPEPIILREELLDPEAWKRLAEEMLSTFFRWLPSLLAAVLILVAFFFVYRLAVGLLGRLMTSTRADPAVQGIATRLLKYSLLVLAVVMAASQLGIQVGSLLAGVGIIGLAIGLAAQDTLANLVAGITILWDRPFRIGDNVTVSGTFGQVQEIGLRTTRIRTVEQLDTILPNKEIINATIVNHTMNPMMRLGIPIGIAYKEDTRKARTVLLGAVRGHDLLLDEPEPQVVVTALGDSSVDLELRVWLRDPHREREATFAMVETAKIALDDAGIEIPFPQRTLHFPDGVGVRRLGPQDRRNVDGEGE
jgi:small conductance mechanosensitive channel